MQNDAKVTVRLPKKKLRAIEKHGEPNEPVSRTIRRLIDLALVSKTISECAK